MSLPQSSYYLINTKSALAQSLCLDGFLGILQAHTFFLRWFSICQWWKLPGNVIWSYDPTTSTQKENVLSRVSTRRGTSALFKNDERTFIRSFSARQGYRPWIWTAWPPRSPDLSPLDYWFGGMLKSRVYHLRKPTNLQKLKERIQAKISSITIHNQSSPFWCVQSRETTSPPCRKRRWPYWTLIVSL